MINVTVSTQLKLNKSPYYFAVLHWIDANKKQHYKWKTTKVKYIDEKQKRLHKQAEIEANNKAEELRITFEKELNALSLTISEEEAELNELANQNFANYLKDWALQQQTRKSKSTSSGYQSIINNIIAPFFANYNLPLKNVKPIHLQEFYNAQYKRVLTKGKNKGKLVSKNTVHHYHTTIHKALADAVKLGIIPSNPDDRTIVASPDEYTAEYYTEQEANLLLEKAKGTELELIINLAIYYGLRRSEIIGIKTDAIDLEKNTITIKHKVTQATIDNKRVLIQEDKMKNKSSYRTLPLIPRVKELIIKELENQKQFRKLYGNTYKNNDNYLCVRNDGSVVNPDTITQQFNKFIAKNNLKPITLHSCRHSCGSILLANGVNIKEIQEWLGHSTYNTTANIYLHCDISGKLNSANTMSNIFSKEQIA